ncbi:MAG: response regulator [Pseudomonadota bacterium]
MTEHPVRLNAEDIQVYLVDDDRGMVSSTSQWLSLSGVKIKAFADPIALMKVIRAEHPCVVVSDIRMPGIDGMELMKLITGRDRRIPVILITGHGDIPLAVEAMKIGAFEFLSKPFSPEKLLEAVKKAQVEYADRIAVAEPELPETDPDKGQEQTQDNPECADANDLSGRVDEFEKELICEVLSRCGGSISRAMAELNVPRRTLNAKMKKHGISRAAFR